MWVTPFQPQLFSISLGMSIDLLRVALSTFLRDVDFVVIICGESFSKMLWPKALKVYIWCVFGVASNGKSVKCWCGNSEAGVATATPAIRCAPLMVVIYSARCLVKA